MQSKLASPSCAAVPSRQVKTGGPEKYNEDADSGRIKGSEGSLEGRNEWWTTRDHGHGATMTVVGTDARIAGRYRLLEVLGTGGMGSVWRAEDEILKRTVAVKLLRPEFAADEASRSRFRIEAQAAASINHPNVVGVYDYGEEATADGECLSYVVMEFVSGRSLADALAEHRRLTARVVCSILEQAALGLDAAHRQGVIHRDVKPANLLLSQHGTLKITDFGIARVADAVPLTRTGTMLGTAQYLSPEQASGAGASPASDLYSLGVVAFTCLSGHPPFDGGNPVATALAHMQDPTPPLPADIPAPLQQLVDDLMAKKPADRPADGREVAARAQSVLGTAVPDTVASPTPTMVLPRPVRFRDSVRKHRRPLAAVPVLVAIAAVVLFTLPASTSLRVPSVHGELIGAARATLAHDGFKVSTTTVDQPRVQAGHVLNQSPAAGHRLAPGQTVDLVVSSGTVNVNASGLTGQTYQTVAARLTALGLQPTESFVPSPVTPNTVVGVSPTGEVRVGSPVTVQVAQTPAPPPHHHDGGGGGGDGGGGGPGGGGH